VGHYHKHSYPAEGCHSVGSAVWKPLDLQALRASPDPGRACWPARRNPQGPVTSLKSRVNTPAKREQMVRSPGGVVTVLFRRPIRPVASVGFLKNRRRGPGTSQVLPTRSDRPQPDKPHRFLLSAASPPGGCRTPCSAS